jgi:hypothetical protein
MNSWPKPLCPNSKCQKRFHAIHEALNPDTDSAEDFFRFINFTRTSRVSKKELAAWYNTNFKTEADDAMDIISTNWHLWDKPKDRPFLKLGWFRSQDHGDLDQDEFAAVKLFMAESLSRSLTAAAAAPAITVLPTQPIAPADTMVPIKPEASLPEGVAACDDREPVPCEGLVGDLTSGSPRGLKRSRSKVADNLTEGVLRRVAQRKMSDSDELQRQLSNCADKGRVWFDLFDHDRSGELEKNELTTALLQTFLGSHQITREQVTSIVDSIWDAVDTDGSGSVHFDEFQILREAVMAQLRHECVTSAIAAAPPPPQLETTLLGTNIP